MLIVDPALSRPGRFDRQVVVDRADKSGREAILNVHARNVKLADDVDLSTIAGRNPGFAGADLANLVNEAAMLATRQNRPAVLMADFNEAIERKVSTGAADDIQKATDLAERAITIYGMSEKLGTVAFEKIQQQFLEGYPNPRRSISPKVAEEIDREVKLTLDNAHHIALSILHYNRNLLEEIAQALLDKEILEGLQLREFLNQVQAPDELDEWLRTGKLLADRPLMQSLLV